MYVSQEDISRSSLFLPLLDWRLFTPSLVIFMEVIFLSLVFIHIDFQEDTPSGFFSHLAS